MSHDSKKPVHSIRYGTGGSYIEVAIWENKHEGRTNHSATFTRSYLKDDQWKKSQSLNASDLPHLALALNQAYMWIQTQQK